MSRNWERRRDDPDAPHNQERRASPAKKNTKRWCRGKRGVEHVPEMVLGLGIGGGDRCYRRSFTAFYREPGDDGYWWCSHRERCANCGKVLNHFPPARLCPDYVPPEIT